MSVDAKLTAQKRTGSGTANCRRLRNSGQVPGNVYGHTQDPVAVQTSHDEILGIVSKGHIAVDLEIEGQAEKAIFREVQWDTFGKQIIHFDLLRVDPEERVHIEVPIDVRGTAPGTLTGGILDVHLHSVHIDCLAYKIPSSITVRIGSLQVGDAIRVADLVLPEGLVVTNAADEIVVQVAAPRKGRDEDEAPAAEPAAEAAKAAPAAKGAPAAKAAPAAKSSK